ncbi:MAG: DNA polymerase III subunit alpha, partial [Gammaproteobacteria bacterium]
HSEYSLVDGMVRIKSLVKAVAGANIPAVAITDQCNLFAMVKFYRAAMSVGIKPIVGVDLWVHNEADPNQPSRLVLLCQSHPGYLNLSRLVSRSYIEGQHRGVPIIQQHWLEGNSEGLIALSGGRAGDVGKALLTGTPGQSELCLEQWLKLFGDRFYLELQRTGREGEESYIHSAVDLAIQKGVPVVATNDTLFLNSDDFLAHEARVCIQEGRTLDDPRRVRRHTVQQYLRTPEEMTVLFEDIPEALENSVEIARRCNLELELGRNFLPEFPVPKGMSVAEYLNVEAHEGLKQRLQQILEPTSADCTSKRQQYEQRLDRELDVIVKMGYPGYFLIVADFIKWAKTHGVPVGPGRGSGAGSLVAYALTITGLDPIEHDLLFERFLNPERVSMPDFDIDFCMEGRDRVIEYVAERYGRDRVSQIITYGSMAAKAVVRDVGRVLGQPYGFVDRIAKLIPFEIGITLDKALAQEEALREYYENDHDVRAIIDLAKSLEGLPRNAGKHAGGVVIAPSELTDHTPLYCEQGSQVVVSQFDKDDVEAVGLVKFDFLGLRTLTIIDHAVKTINGQRARRGDEPIDINTIPRDDPDTFALLKSCATTAVFQLESRGMKDLMKKLQPDSFEDIVALVALFRPGPLQSGMVEDFINRKHGRAMVEYPHPDVEPILGTTYGVILYQEQVMQIAQTLAGYTLGGADLLRRAMGKKKPEEMAQQRTVFVRGATERGVRERVATYIFDLMEKFAGYGFNKSHSAAYALIAYQTAWLKAHYPGPFMAAVLSADMDNTDKVVTLIDECRDMRLKVAPPDCNVSHYKFAVGDDGIVYGLGAIKGVGQAALTGMIEERDANGPFKDLIDLCRRVNLRKLNKRVLEALIRAGALDSLGEHRAILMAQLPDALKVAEQDGHNRNAGQVDLFGEVDSAPVVSAPVVPEWDEEERLKGEKESLGLYLTGHPINRYESELMDITSGPIAELKEQPAYGGNGSGTYRDERRVVLAGWIMGLRTRAGKSGARMAFLTMDDRTARIEVRVFNEVYERYRALLAKDKLLVVEGGLSQDDFSGGYRVTAERIYDIDQAREAFAKRVVVDILASQTEQGFVGALANVLEPFREGGCPVWITYQGESARAQLALGKEWCVHPTDELIHRLKEFAGPERVHVEY